MWHWPESGHSAAGQPDLDPAVGRVLSALDSLAQIGFRPDDPDIARGVAWSVSAPTTTWRAFGMTLCRTYVSCAYV